MTGLDSCRPLWPGYSWIVFRAIRSQLLRLSRHWIGSEKPADVEHMVWTFSSSSQMPRGASYGGPGWEWDPTPKDSQPHNWPRYCTLVPVPLQSPRPSPQGDHHSELSFALYKLTHAVCALLCLALIARHWVSEIQPWDWGWLQIILALGCTEFHCVTTSRFIHSTADGRWIVSSSRLLQKVLLWT